MAKAARQIGKGSGGRRGQSRRERRIRNQGTRNETGMTESGAEKLSVEMCAKKARECRAMADGDNVRLPHRMVLENIADLWERLGAALNPS